MHFCVANCSLFIAGIPVLYASVNGEVRVNRSCFLRLIKTCVVKQSRNVLLVYI